MAEPGKRPKQKNAGITQVEQDISAAIIPRERLEWVGNGEPVGDLAVAAMLDEMRVVFDPASLVLSGPDQD